jgi:hypothetical protein
MLHKHATDIINEIPHEMIIMILLSMAHIFS